MNAAHRFILRVLLAIEALLILRPPFETDSGRKPPPHTRASRRPCLGSHRPPHARAMAGSPMKRMRKAGVTDPVTGELIPFPYMPRVAELRHGRHDLAPGGRSSIVAGERQLVSSNGAFLERSLAIALDHELRRPPNVDLRYQSARLMKSPPGPPMTLGNAAAVRVRLIVWCKACGHQVEPDPAEMARQYGATTSVLDWRDRLLCSSCGSRVVDMVVTGTERR